MKKKIDIRFFTICEYNEEERYLRRMHKNGWRYRNLVLPFFYVFDKVEPEDVIYQLDYNTDNRRSHPEYIQMYSDMGWEYINDCVGFSYFRKPVGLMKSNEEIFSDDYSKLDMIKRVIKGRMIPLLVLFFGVIIPQIILQIEASNPFGKAFFVIYCLLFVLYCWVFIKTYLKYRKLCKNIV